MPATLLHPLESGQAVYQEPAALAVDVLNDARCQERAGELIRAAAYLAVQGYAGLPEKNWSNDQRTLQAAIWSASHGDQEARQVIVQNAAADLVERRMKAGHVMEVPLDEDVDGGIRQYGQRMSDVLTNANALNLTPAMRARTEAETRNGMRMRAALHRGWLEDHTFVIISRSPDDMTPEEAERAGFFIETMSCAIQVVRRVGRDLVQQSAFVAGVTEAEGVRHDAKSIKHMLAELGVTLPDDITATALIDQPLLVPNARIPNGVIDLVRLYDEGTGTFFGQNVPHQDYLKYLAVCREREKRMMPMAQAVTNDLIREASSIQAPLDAIRRLHQLSQHYLVSLALTDTAVNPNIFGVAAAQHIIAARQFLAEGNMEGFTEARLAAQQTARSSSCPIGDIFGNSITGSAEASDANSFSKEPGPAGKKRMTCPFCKDKNQYHDPCTEIVCTACGSSSVHGESSKKAKAVTGFAAGTLLANLGKLLGNDKQVGMA